MSSIHPSLPQAEFLPPSAGPDQPFGAELIAWHPHEPDLLLTCSLKQGLRLWDVGGQRVAAVPPAFGEMPINVEWDREGRVVCVGCRDDWLHFYRFDGHEIAPAGKHHCRFEANQFKFSQQGHLLLAAGPGNLVVLAAPSYSTVSANIACHTHAAYCIDVFACGQKELVAVGAGDGMLSLWEGAGTACLATIARCERPVRACSFSHDGLFVALGGDDKFIDIALCPSGESVFRLAVPASVQSLCWHPSSYLLAYVCDEVDRNGRFEGVVRVFGFNQ